MNLMPLKSRALVVVSVLLFSCTPTTSPKTDVFVEARGVIERIPLSVEVSASHKLQSFETTYLLRSNAINLREFEAKEVLVTGTLHAIEGSAMEVIQVETLEPKEQPSSSGSSISSSSYSSVSSISLGAPCGGTAGILCPAGQYCFITDPESNTGRCAQ